MFSWGATKTKVGAGNDHDDLSGCLTNTSFSFAFAQLWLRLTFLGFWTLSFWLLQSFISPKNKQLNFYLHLFYISEPLKWCLRVKPQADYLCHQCCVNGFCFGEKCSFVYGHMCCTDLFSLWFVDWAPKTKRRRRTDWRSCTVGEKNHERVVMFQLQMNLQSFGEAGW